MVSLFRIWASKFVIVLNRTFVDPSYITELLQLEDIYTVNEPFVSEREREVAIL